MKLTYGQLGALYDLMREFELYKSIGLTSIKSKRPKPITKKPK